MTPGSGLKLRISKKGEYGLAALIYIASKPVGRRSFRDEIARHCGIPKNYLARILCRLKEAGILGAVRGANGGYFLKGSPGEPSASPISWRHWRGRSVFTGAPPRCRANAPNSGLAPPGERWK